MGAAPVTLGGSPVVVLSSEQDTGVVAAAVAPGRGMMLLQAWARTPDGRLIELLETPPLEELPALLDGGPQDFAGNAAFSVGGALLLPYANRIRGRPAAGRTIETEVAGRTVRLPMNWGGKAPGAEQYAMHGLVLDLNVMDVRQPTPGEITACVTGHDFGGRWPSRADLTFSWRLEGGRLQLRVAALNVGQDILPMGIGWHPWLRIPSGQRAQARLKVPARSRLAVDDYDQVLPTGEILSLAGSDRDVGAPDGVRLGDIYLDDCFVDLSRSGGDMTVELVDAAAGLSIRLRTSSPAVTAVQVYAPPDRALAVMEPQFNWPDPYGACWRGRPTGMVELAPEASVAYEVALEVGASS